MKTLSTPIEAKYVQWLASKRTYFTAPPSTGSSRSIRALEAACDWTTAHLRWIIAAAVVVAVGYAANVFGADEIELEHHVEQLVLERAAESRFLAAEAAMERDLQVAAAAGR